MSKQQTNNRLTRKQTNQQTKPAKLLFFRLDPTYTGTERGEGGRETERTGLSSFQTLNSIQRIED